MNLAKIRQKARENLTVQSGGVTTGGQPPAVDMSQAISAFTVPEMAAAELAETGSELLDGMTSPKSQSGLCGMEPGVARIVHDDPIGLIMAGRRQACCVDQEITVSDSLVSGEVPYDEYLGVRVGDEVFGIDIMVIKEIIRPREVTELPAAPPYLTGFISLRGVIVPVIDMLVRLGMSGQPDPQQQRVVVVRAGDGFSGLLVDEVIQVVRLTHGTQEPSSNVLDGLERDFASGIGRFDGRVITLLNLETIADVNRC